MAETLSELLRERYGRSPSVPEGLESSPELRAIAAHRSHRRFADRPVPDALLDTLLACAFAAPSKSDLQQSCVIDVREPSLRALFVELIPSMAWIGEAPVFLVFCGENRRIRRICEMRGPAFANDHLDSFFNASVDAALVMMSFIHAAEAAGLGCCPVSAVRIHARRLSDAMGLPAHVFPVAGLALGYPGQARKITPRLGLAASVHRDRYDDSRLPDLLDEYDRRRDAVLPLAPDKQRRPDQFGVAAFYGWSEDKARQVAVRERGDFGAFARDQGFSLD